MPKPDCADAQRAPPERAASCEKTSLLPLNVKQLTFKISGKSVIDNLSFNLKRPGITMVMGPNGAGKSVLLRLLHGLITPSSGSISWNGKSPNDTIRKRQALIFQRPILLRRSVAANIDFALSTRLAKSKEKRDRLLNEVGLLDRASQPARALSGGEQQRLSLARAISTNPEVLFLDEPTANLDPASTQSIEQLVTRMHALGTKIIFVTHDIGQARRLGDEILFMHRGRLVEQTKASAFFESATSKEARTYLQGHLIL